MIESLIENARRLIGEQLAVSQSPAVLWSGGEDSQLLLWLVREWKRDVPVIHFRSLPSETKHAFADRIIAEWGLPLSDVPRVGVDVVANGDEVNLIEEYAVSPKFHLYLPLENEPGRPVDRDSTCAIRVLNEKRGGIGRISERLHDVVFIGHHAEDGDLVLGLLEPKESVSQGADVQMIYPLVSWTKADVRAASKLLGVPQNDARYAGDLTVNSDYFPLCVECLKPGRTEEEITCPKLNVPVFNLGKVLHPEYRREVWRSRFINIKESHVVS